MGDFKKNFLQAVVGRKKMHAALALLQARKNVVKIFHHSWGALQNPRKTATIPDTLQASKPLWIAYQNDTLIGLNNTLVSLNNTPVDLQLA